MSGHLSCFPDHQGRLNATFTMSHLLAGTGRCDITSAPGTPQGGWGAQTYERGISPDLPLLATALVLSDGSESVAILDVDAIGFDREWTDRIVNATAELACLPRDRIRLSCSHTHSGPNPAAAIAMLRALVLIFGPL
jgi:hypothetical protein